MLPRVNDGLSLINFILELKDLRRMFDWKSVDKLLYKRLNKMPRRVLKPEDLTSKDLAGDFLNYQFGWRPFVGDLIAMWKAFRGLSKRLDYLEANAGKLIRRNSSYDIVDGIDLPAWESLYGPIGGVWGGDPIRYYGSDLPHVTQVARWVYKPRLHATLVYHYTLPRVSEIRRKIRGYLDAFGVRLDPSIIWNAIPLSFVVDWVLDVGGFLRRFTPNDLGMEVSVHDASYSLKYHMVSDTNVSSPTDTHGVLPAISSETVCQYTHRYYERVPWIPNLFSVSSQLPSGMQYALGGALGISRERGLRQPRVRRH
jgi:hypothetical protein